MMRFIFSILFLAMSPLQTNLAHAGALNVSIQTADDTGSARIDESTDGVIGPPSLFVSFAPESLVFAQARGDFRTGEIGVSTDCLNQPVFGCEATASMLERVLFDATGVPLPDETAPIEEFYVEIPFAYNLTGAVGLNGQLQSDLIITTNPLSQPPRWETRFLTLVNNNLEECDVVSTTPTTRIIETELDGNTCTVLTDINRQRAQVDPIELDFDGSGSHLYAGAINVRKGEELFVQFSMGLIARVNADYIGTGALSLSSPIPFTSDTGIFLQGIETPVSVSEPQFPYLLSLFGIFAIRSRYRR